MEDERTSWCGPELNARLVRVCRHARSLPRIILTSKYKRFSLLLISLASLMGACSSLPPTVEVSVMPKSAAIGVGQAISFAAKVTGDTENLGVTWSVNGVTGGKAGSGTIDADGHYTAPSMAPSTAVRITAISKRDSLISESATVWVIAPGTVSPSIHPLVALYAMTLPTDATVSVEFGPDINYGLRTWARPEPSNGGTVGIQVAGMRENTTYHMRAVVRIGSGITYKDPDRTFTTGEIPPNISPTLAVTTTPGMTPQSGVEMINAITPGQLQATAIDLFGNIIWYYSYTGTNTDLIQSIHLMPNGNLLMAISPASTLPLASRALPAGAISAVREIDLAGNTVREISIDELNTKLTATGYTVTLNVFHHDVLPLANGHWIVLANTIKQFVNLPGYPGPKNVLGDVLVDLDTDLNPVWVWNEFDYMDVTRHPLSFPDWTHTNAVIYSADDENLLVSVRNQNWLLKIDYEGGRGDGHIVWHLGEGGEFQLSGGMDPTDWFFAQHGPSFVGPNTTGQFLISVFDNGDDRTYLSNSPCYNSPASSCFYSTVAVLDIDEQAMTATVAIRDTSPPYSSWGGNAEVLRNGNLEYDVASVPPSYNSSDVYEVTPGDSTQAIWHLTINGQNAYRAFRVPSLYPGVQW
jgi:arylsulfate sulfotransferase